MCVIQVRLSHVNYPENEILVYAVLDDCSKGTFILDSSLVDLNTHEVHKTSVILSTMTGCVEEDTLLVKGLMVQKAQKNIQ